MQFTWKNYLDTCHVEGTHFFLEFIGNAHLAGLCNIKKGDINPRVGEGSGTLLQYSCLDNPTDGGAW